MRRLVAMLAVAVALVAPGVLTLPASAQSGSELISGVVIGVDTNEAGELERFALTDSGGNDIVFTVNDSTEFGLENQAGDRWVATQGAEPVEAVRRLRDHQSRFAAVTVTAESGVALSVVEREGGKLETNLKFLFAVFAVTWAGFFAYVFWVSGRQRELQREVARLRAKIDIATEN